MNFVIIKNDYMIDINLCKIDGIESLVSGQISKRPNASLVIVASL